MKWLLLFWLQSTDSGFPGVEPGYVSTPFETQASCAASGEDSLKKSPFVMQRVVAYMCVQGNVAGVGKSEGQK